jgi:hypothetical protein
MDASPQEFSTLLRFIEGSSVERKSETVSSLRGLAAEFGISELSCECESSIVAVLMKVADGVLLIF